MAGSHTFSASFTAARMAAHSTSNIAQLAATSMQCLDTLPEQLVPGRKWVTLVRLMLKAKPLEAPVPTGVVLSYMCNRLKACS
jgi:hypothetical protein